jgi:hypothetical protein
LCCDWALGVALDYHTICICAVADILQILECGLILKCVLRLRCGTWLLCWSSILLCNSMMLRVEVTLWVESALTVEAQRKSKSKNYDEKGSRLLCGWTLTPCSWLVRDLWCCGWSLSLCACTLHVLWCRSLLHCRCWRSRYRGVVHCLLLRIAQPLIHNVESFAQCLTARAFSIGEVTRFIRLVLLHQRGRPS